MSEWAYQWKMSFNTDQKKQAEKVIISRNKRGFNNMPVSCLNFQKHFGINLDQKLHFNYHVKEKIGKAMQGVGVIRKLCNKIPRNYLITIFKSLVIKS